MNPFDLKKLIININIPGNQLILIMGLDALLFTVCSLCNDCNLNAMSDNTVQALIGLRSQILSEVVTELLHLKSLQHRPLLSEVQQHHKKCLKLFLYGVVWLKTMS